MNKDVPNELDEEVNKLFTNLHKTVVNYLTQSLKDKEDRAYEPTDVLMLALAKLSCLSLACGNDSAGIKKSTEVYLKQVRIYVDMFLLDLEMGKH